MTETTNPTPQAEPKQLCEKCRIAYPLDQFNHGHEGYEHVCNRCMRVMGYGH